MADRDPLNVLAEELALALQPLSAAFSSPDALRDFLQELGWDFSAAPSPLDSLRAPVEQVLQLASSVESVEAADIGRLLNGIRAAFNAISDLSSAGGLANDFKNEFPRQLVDYLLVEYLLRNQPRWGNLLLALGVVRLERVAAAPPRPAYLRRIFAFEDFGAFFNNPLVFFENAYHWGGSDFRGELLIESLAGLFAAWGLEVRQQSLDAQTLAVLNAGALQPNDAFDSSLRFIIIEDDNEPVDFEAGVGLFLLPETASAKPGFALLPFASAGLVEEFALTDQLTLLFDGEMDLTGGLGVLVRPDRDIEFLLGFASGTPSAASGNLVIRLRLANSEAPFVLIGDPQASRFQVAGVSTSAGTRFHSNGKFEVFAEFALEEGKIIIKPGPDEQDGFLAKLLPGEGLQIGADLSIGFSTTQGVYFGGSGGLEINLPAHIQLGPIEIMSALVAVKFKNGGIPVELAATIKGDLSVLKAVVENVGLTATFSFPPDRKGNLGPVNLALGFRPPNGVGLTVDAGVVKGGGYLYFDFDKGEYAGALELTIANFLSLKAIGLINTRLPGGQPGFSLLMIITAEFSPGFQLGYGFVLIGVGGLLGLNRTMLLEPLAERVRTGAVNSILFPTDVVANAPKILSDLRAIFPPQEGIFLIGPMAKIGWGTPTLISLALGVIIEIPGNVVILGRLRAALPTEETAVLVLQVTFIGALEFDKRRIWFFATLYESRVLFITLEGEMGLLMDFSDNPNFVLSVGGFHPRFTAPPLPFPSPARLSLSIINESWARVRAELYFAITSNSVQLGCRAEAFFGFDAFSVEGYFSFDALLRFSPFYFIVEISTGFSVKVFGVGVWGVHLRGSFEGPTPYRVRGSAKIEILFFSFSVDVDVTFGETRSDLLPPIEVMPKMRAEFEKLESWRATLPPSGQLFVSLRQIDAGTALVLHPVGTLQISQRFAPLNLPLDKIGNQKPSDVKKVTVAAQTAALAVKGATREKFAAAQYREMDDAAKLSAPAYEPLESGVELGAAGQPWAAGPLAQRTVRYETILIDTAFERFRIRFFKFWDALFVHFRAGSAVARAEVSLANEKKRRPFASKVAVTDDQFTVAFQSDNRAFAEAATFGSFAEAQAFMAESVARDPALADSIHVIPQAEVNQVA
jgi:hypothetical protein